MNATAHVTPQGAELWVPTQYQSMVREVVAEILGLPLDKVDCAYDRRGWWFRSPHRDRLCHSGRKDRAPCQAAGQIDLVPRRRHVARLFSPHGRYPSQSGLGARGQPTAFSFAAACPSIMDYSIERRHGVPQQEVDQSGLANARNWPYAVPAQKIALASTDLDVPVTWMRSVGSVASVFGLECFLDEMAAVAKDRSDRLSPPSPARSAARIGGSRKTRFSFSLG